jgi:TonB-dependent starch-binding outer membrane protein SusC
MIKGMQFNCNYLPGMVCPGKPKQRLINRQLLRIMRLTAILLTVFFLQVKADGLSQAISFSGKDVPLQKVLEAIRKQSGYIFFYKENILQEARPVTIAIKNVTVEEAVRQALKDQPFQYYITSKTVVISKKREVTKDEKSLASDPAFIDVHGRVVNEKGDPVANVSVTIKGTSTSTATDENGDFALHSVNQDAVLVFTHVSMESFELKVSGKTDLAITLKTKISELSNVSVVVSTGYQNIPKERATGSFTQVDNTLFNRGVSTNILERIFKVSNGLNYEPISKGGSPLQIRGISTINANQFPLIVIDGFPYEESGTSGAILNNVNPNDIESVTILKDAAAASIWGVRAGNGVIVITTKQGKLNQKPHVQLNTNFTIGEKPNIKYLPAISSSDEIDVEENLFNSGFYDSYDDAANFNYFSDPLPQVAELLIAKRRGSISQAQFDDLVEKYKNKDVRDDVNKYLLRNSFLQQYSVNFSGGTSNYSYYSSIGYDENKVSTKGNESKRLTLRFDNKFKPIKNLEIGGFISYCQIDNYDNGLNYMDFLPIGISRITPYTSLADENEIPIAIPHLLRVSYVDTFSAPGFLNWQYKPLDELRNNDNVSKSYAARIGASLRYNILNGLTGEIKYQLDNNFSHSDNNYNTQTFYTRNLINQYIQIGPTGEISYIIPNASILDRFNTQAKSTNIRADLNFNKVWLNHDVSVIGGAERREVNSSGERIRYYGYDPNTASYSSSIDYINSYLLNPGPYAGSAYVSNNNYPIPKTLQRYLSYFANGAYTFQNKYTFSASGRIDGTNFFGIKKSLRTTPLWSTGLLWDMSKEQFYKVSWLPYLKFRFTYGYNGNMYNGAAAFPTITYSSNPSPLNNTSYALVTSPGNPQLTWEKVKMTNIALDFGLFKNRVSGSFDLYYKRGENLIGLILVDPTRGFANYVGNNASIKGHGIDIILNSKPLTGAINWTTNFSFSYNIDKVISYTEAAKENTSAANVIGGKPVIGKPLYSLYSYKWAGLDPQTGDPRGYVGDTISSYNDVLTKALQPRDVVYSGSLNPRFFGSLINTLGYKNLSFSFNIVYKFDYFFRRSSISYTNLFSAWSGHSDYSLRWQKPGDESKTSVPSLELALNPDRDFFYQNSSALIERADHIRLQDVRLNYDLNSKSIKWLPVQSAQFYVYVNNIGILWRANNHGIDPDFGSSVIPNPRTLTLGLKADF